MKKLLLLLTVLLTAFALSACTPDGDTAEDIQNWYDQCETIPTCQAKVDELREDGLNDSDIINEVKGTLGDHEIRIKALEDEVFGLNERMTLVDTLVLGPSNIHTLLDNYGFSDTVWVWENSKDAVDIWVNVEGIVWELEVTEAVVKNKLKEAFLLDLSEVVNPEDVTLHLIVQGGLVVEVELTTLLK